MQNLTNDRLLDDLLLDKWAFTLQCVGRKNMTALELWHRWIES